MHKFRKRPLEIKFAATFDIIEPAGRVTSAATGFLSASKLLAGSLSRKFLFWRQTKLERESSSYLDVWAAAVLHNHKWLVVD